MLVGWFSDLPAIASSGETSGIAQETISYHYVSEKLLKTDKPTFAEYLPRPQLTANPSFNPPKANIFHTFSGVIV